jgi:hypothetical protein
MRQVIFATVSVISLLSVTNPAKSWTPPDSTTFALSVNPQFKACLGPNPTASVKVTRGSLNDKLVINFSGITPNLQFDLFTIQRSQLDENSNPVSNFPGFGLSWYQTDLEADSDGKGSATINTILLDQIFGFDADKQTDGVTQKVVPTNTFHVGFWFNNPQDAAQCGFDPSKPTPFNGEHKAGPNAMISVPSGPAQLGPLCTSPTGLTQDDVDKDTTGTAFLCNP